MPARAADLRRYIAAIARRCLLLAAMPPLTPLRYMICHVAAMLRLLSYDTLRHALLTLRRRCRR